MNIVIQSDIARRHIFKFAAGTFDSCFIIICSLRRRTDKIFLTIWLGIFLFHLIILFYLNGTDNTPSCYQSSLPIWRGWSEGIFGDDMATSQRSGA
jgi:hypothetical protein